MRKSKKEIPPHPKKDPHMINDRGKVNPMKPNRFPHLVEHKDKPTYFGHKITDLTKEELQLVVTECILTIEALEKKVNALEQEDFKKLIETFKREKQSEPFTP
jgi:hypothetical protein